MTIRPIYEEYKQLGIDQQIDYAKFYLYSIITHSTAIEGSTVTELENRLLFDEHAQLLSSLGFDIRPFGNDTIVVGGVPDGFSCERGRNTTPCWAISLPRKVS